MDKGPEAAVCRAGSGQQELDMPICDCPSDVTPVTLRRWPTLGLGEVFTPQAPADAANQGSLFLF